MTEHTSSAYGLWFLVFAYSAVFILFALSFTKPKTARDWRTFGAFSAFIIALFVEMYGIPVTIFLISGWLQSRYPGLDLLSHQAGHLWWIALGLKGDPHFGILHRSEEHTSELQSLMRISSAVFCLKKKKNKKCSTN